MKLLLVFILKIIIVNFLFFKGVKNGNSFVFLQFSEKLRGNFFDELLPKMDVDHSFQMIKRISSRMDYFSNKTPEEEENGQNLSIFGKSFQNFFFDFLLIFENLHS